MRGWPGFAGMEPEAAAGARVGAGLALRLANELVIALALLHGSVRVQRTHARGHLVTGASPVMSLCGGAVRSSRGDGYNKKSRRGRVGFGAEAHSGHAEKLRRLGEASGTAYGRRRSRCRGGGVELDAKAPLLLEMRDSSRTKRRL